jgi:hypothetical protein
MQPEQDSGTAFHRSKPKEHCERNLYFVKVYDGEQINKKNTYGVKAYAGHK